MKVKICGITNYEDAAAAVELGADALGFNFYRRSPRYIEPEAARAIIRRLPPFVAAVGLFVDEGPEEVCRAARAAGVGVLQLHGDETPDYCGRLSGWPLIKALRVGGALDAAGLADYEVQAFLLDARDGALYGGTGKVFDWSLAAAVRGVAPIILAGGLRPDNVAEAIRTARPYGVDVSSGVESSPGRKDRALVGAFIEEVRNACKSI